MEAIQMWTAVKCLSTERKSLLWDDCLNPCGLSLLTERSQAENHTSSKSAHAQGKGSDGLDLSLTCVSLFYGYLSTSALVKTLVRQRHDRKPSSWLNRLLGLTVFLLINCSLYEPLLNPLRWWEQHPNKYPPLWLQYVRRNAKDFAVISEFWILKQLIHWPNTDVLVIKSLPLRMWFSCMCLVFLSLP